jgi:hypothetical protein
MFSGTYGYTCQCAGIPLHTDALPACARDGRKGSLHLIMPFVISPQ